MKTTCVQGFYQLQIFEWRNFFCFHPWRSIIFVHFWRGSNRGQMGSFFIWILNIFIPKIDHYENNMCARILSATNIWVEKFFFAFIRGEQIFLCIFFRGPKEVYFHILKECWKSQLLKSNTKQGNTRQRQRQNRYLVGFYIERGVAVPPGENLSKGRPTAPFSSSFAPRYFHFSNCVQRPRGGLLVYSEGSEASPPPLDRYVHRRCP